MLDDLHWCDASSLDWIAAFALRTERARLMLIGMFRPEALERQGPLAALMGTLAAKSRGLEIALGGLDTNAVVEFLALRHPPASGQDASLNHLAAVLHRHTEGNPLFLVNVLDDLVERQLLVVSGGRWGLKRAVDAIDVGIPENVRRAIEYQRDYVHGIEGARAGRRAAIRPLLDLLPVLGGTPIARG